MNISVGIIAHLTSCKPDEIKCILKSLNAIKEMVSVQCVTIELWMHLGGLLSTQEARVTIASCDSYASFALSNLPRVSITRYSCTLHAYHFLITQLL